MAPLKEFDASEVATHKTKNDIFVIIHGKVYDITNYVRDHPGGADVLLDVAGTDATEAYEDVGHSEDANEILETYLVGTVKDAHEFVQRKVVRVIKPTSSEIETPKKSSIVLKAATTVAATALVYVSSKNHQVLASFFAKHTPASLQLSEVRLPFTSLLRGGFSSGVTAATLACTAIGGAIGIKLSKFTEVESGFTKYRPYMKASAMKKQDPHLVKGFLEPKNYKKLSLIQKDQLSPNVYRFVFQLPNKRDVIGLPIGQHVAIKAMINGASVSRSYTPTSNNLDLGKLELVIKCYPDGLLTGQYLESLEVGDKVEFRGPKGAMKYHNGLCKKIGMIAGGTGITPMYQLIRAICEDDRDTTEISLIYANRSEEDILLRRELEAFARGYPKNFKLWYMLDHPSDNWAYGKGYVTGEVMTARLPGPAPDTKIMLCGPPGMVNASKKSLVAAGFKPPGAVGKMTDEIFCF
ncbi:Cytochrome b5 [Penicillium cf. griseofulvum]|uniref:Cytochrome b5 n=1 Tax=Penicillium cf. griseofulvum TaxID=2972120 RepID=A0A9W9JUA6_9EURO|nr:Cytochrome b5 [Penicillium cf. griseofulvum]KAJ5423808.1 Cytochrome b5 [Penicillium cf. griseofulvum]KAJ5430939.1 Cytochrome b5 [Penicillium cf. griseofulvum]